MPKTKLVYAVEMLHYLPLYIAHERDLRDQLDIELAPAPHGDKSAISRLMSDATNDADVNFCVCDPMMVSLEDAYSAVGANAPVVIGQLVGKVPFWAVNHAEPAFSDEEGFGGYSQIFSYPDPNTGYIFGKLIYAPFEHKKPNLTSFRPTKPIDDDLDFYLTSDQAVVIEADVLRIRKFTEKTGNRVVFSFARSAAYESFCFTAIITHRNFLETPSGQAQARELVRALTKATDLIYTFPEIALEHAVSRFCSKGYSREIVKGALGDLTKEEIFSRSPIVSRDGWRKSGYIRRQVAADFAFPSFDQFVENGIAKKEFLAYLQEKTGKCWFLLPNVSRLIAALFRKVAPFVIAAMLYIHPSLFVHLRSRLPDVLWNPWILLHFLATTIVVAIYCSRDRIAHWTKKDPTKWLEWGYGLIFAYIIAELVIVAEVIRLPS
jgi:hypothetical protein